MPTEPTEPPRTFVMPPPTLVMRIGGRGRRDRGDVSFGAVLLWLVVTAFAFLAAFGVGRSGLLGGEGATPDGSGGLAGRVLDRTTGVPVAGATVHATDETGTDLPDATATTAADGTFTIPGITAEEIGVRIDGTTIGYETGWVGADTPTPFGWQVFPTWTAASTWTPIALGDIALDPTGPPVTAPAPATTPAPAPAPPPAPPPVAPPVTPVATTTVAPATTTTPTTAPSTTTTVAPTTTVRPTTTTVAPTTTLGDTSAPEVSNLAAAPATILEDLGAQSACVTGGTTTTTVSASVVDRQSGVASVIVSWSVRRNGSGNVLASGDAAMSALGRGIREVVIGPFGDVLPGFGDDGTVTVTVTATNGAGLTTQATTTIALRDCTPT